MHHAGTGPQLKYPSVLSSLCAPAWGGGVRGRGAWTGGMATEEKNLGTTGKIFKQEDAEGSTVTA